MKSHSLNVLMVVSAFSLMACSQQAAKKSTIQPKPTTSTKTYYVDAQKHQAQQVVFQRQQDAKSLNTYIFLHPLFFVLTLILLVCRASLHLQSTSGGSASALL